MLQFIRRRLGFVAAGVAGFIWLTAAGCDGIPRSMGPLAVLPGMRTERLDIENGSLVSLNNAYFYRRSMLHWGIDAP